MKHAFFATFLLILSISSFGQLSSWGTIGVGHTTDNFRYNFKLEASLEGARWFSLGVDYTYSNKLIFVTSSQNFPDFTEEFRPHHAIAGRLDIHPLFFWSDDSAWDPYLGIVAGQYGYAESGISDFDWSPVAGVRYYWNNHWGVDLELGVRERTLGQLGISYRL